MVSEVTVPIRRGPRPRTTATNPHTQLDQQPGDPRIREALARQVFAMPGVEERHSGISVPGARALWLAAYAAAGPPPAFLIGREFAHLHPAPDFSLHMMLPDPVRTAAFEAGWAEPHPMAARGLIPQTAVMVYAPRDEDELGVVVELVKASHRFASAAAEA
jgi:hypothetical protein